MENSLLVVPNFSPNGIFLIKHISVIRRRQYYIHLPQNDYFDEKSKKKIQNIVPFNTRDEYVADDSSHREGYEWLWVNRGKKINGINLGLITPLIIEQVQDYGYISKRFERILDTLPPEKKELVISRFVEEKPIIFESPFKEIKSVKRISYNKKKEILAADYAPLVIILEGITVREPVLTYLSSLKETKKGELLWLKSLFEKLTGTESKGDYFEEKAKMLLQQSAAYWDYFQKENKKKIQEKRDQLYNNPVRELENKRIK
jgi:hypothetical protein